MTGVGCAAGGPLLDSVRELRLGGPVLRLKSSGASPSPSSSEVPLGSVWKEEKVMKVVKGPGEAGLP